MVPPDHDDQLAILIAEAWGLYSSGRYRDALDATIDNAGPDNAECEYLRACCYSKLREYDSALSGFSRSLEIEPHSIQTIMGIAAVLNAQGNHNEAIRAYEKTLYIDPENLFAHVELAKLYGETGDYKSACELLHKTSQQHPESGLPHHVLGLLARQSGEAVTTVHRHFASALRLDPDNPDYLLSFGECLLNQDRYDEARIFLSKSLKSQPKNPYTAGRLAAVCVKQGDMNIAIRLIDKIVNNNIYLPDVAITYLLCCKKANSCDAAINYAHICLDDPALTSDDRRNIHSKLAAVYDSMGEYHDAWKHLISSKECISIDNRYDPVGHQAYIDRLMEVFHPGKGLKLPRSDISNKHTPIFIIGMPRSGTSLTEQILSAHPDVTGGGELTRLQEIIDELPALISSPKPWPFCVDDMVREDMNMIAEKYHDHISKVSENTGFVTDKMPHNYYAVGLIKQIFPQAKILHCVRDPLDTCISIFFQKFKYGHLYSSNLFDLGTHYNQYLKLMDHWKSLYDMFEVNYEELVSQPEVTIRSILDYCGLGWDENCLNFNEVKRYVLTASFDQVRQPLHTRSVKRWMHYDKYLDDLREGLKRGY